MEVRSDKGQLCGECGLPAELAVKFGNARSPTCGGCVAAALGILQRARTDAAKAAGDAMREAAEERILAIDPGLAG
jgi:hypothetical protein